MQTTTKKYALTIALIMLFLAAFGYWAASQQTPVTPPTKLKNWKTFQSGDFSLQYPDLYVYTAGDFSDYPAGSSLVTAGGQPGTVPVIATFAIDESGYAGTNLAAVWITVSETSATNTAECQTTYYGASTVPLDRPAEINDITWNERVEGWVAGAAAGTTFESRIYHTYHNDICYEVALNLATTNIGNYAPGTVTAVDEGALRAQLQGIFHTVQFTQ